MAESKTTIETKTIREVMKDKPIIKERLYYFDYKDLTSNKYKNLEEILWIFGYKIIDEDKNILGDYNDIKGYLDVLVTAV